LKHWDTTKARLTSVVIQIQIRIATKI